MTTFRQRIVSDDVIAVPTERVWEILLNPQCLADLTPLVDEITAEGRLWTWRLVGVSALGLTAAPRFTTAVNITDESIEFGPVDGSSDRASAAGHLRVTAVDEAHTMVAIDLVASVDLPLPKMAAGAVQRVMFATMRTGGSRFAAAMIRHLGDPWHRGLDVGKTARESSERQPA